MNPTPSTPLPTPFVCENCDHKPTAQEVLQHEGDCAKCGDTVMVFVIDAADCISQLNADLATARSEASLARSEASVATAALARSEERVKELQEKYDCEEEAHGKTISQRDQAEEAADKMASAILGESIDWSDHEGKWEEAIEAIAALADKLARSERELAEANGRHPETLTFGEPDGEPDSPARLRVSLPREVWDRMCAADAAILKTKARAESAEAALATAKDESEHLRLLCADRDYHFESNLALRAQLAAATARCGELEQFIDDSAALEDDRPDDEQGSIKEWAKYDVRRNAMNRRLAAIRAATIAKASAAGGLAGEGTS